LIADCGFLIANCGFLICGLRILDCGLRIEIAGSAIWPTEANRFSPFLTILKRASFLLLLESVNRKAEELQARTHAFFLRVCRLCESLVKNSTTTTIMRQLTDSAGSTDSNYRSACRGRTKKEFIAKIGVAAEEADESKGWLMNLLDAGYGDRLETEALIQEAHELTAIFVASEKTARRNMRRRGG
jgi:four helix bundle protein